MVFGEKWRVDGRVIDDGNGIYVRPYWKYVSDGMNWMCSVVQ